MILLFQGKDFFYKQNQKLKPKRTKQTIYIQRIRNTLASTKSRMVLKQADRMTGWMETHKKRTNSFQSKRCIEEGGEKKENAN